MKTPQGRYVLNPTWDRFGDGDGLGEADGWLVPSSHQSPFFDRRTDFGFKVMGEAPNVQVLFYDDKLERSSIF